MTIFLGLLTAVSIGVAFLLPGQILSAVLGLFGVACLVAACHRNLNFKTVFLIGILTNCIGFYWLLKTISYFGGFGILPAVSIFSLYLAVSSLQFVLFLWLYRSLPNSLDKFALRATLAWTTAEILPLQIFPWSLAHTQLAFGPLVQIADIAGAHLITFVMLWLIEALLLLKFKQLTLSLSRTILPICLFLVSLAYGWYRIQSFTSSSSGPTQQLSVVQANLSVEEKHNQRLFANNVERYIQLSSSAITPNTLLIWPETVITDLIPRDIRFSRDDSHLPQWEIPTYFLTGALTYSPSERQIFNSALGILPDQSILEVYDKQILMPFGEYVPFAGLLPWLRSITGIENDFGRGREAKILTYTADLKVGPLICYEDIIPGIARDSVRLGANLLVNLTNDAWFGNSAAPHQHNLLAAFRAIENRRYLVRSTNSGLTSIINPLGQTVSSLPAFSDGVLKSDVRLISYLTIYTDWLGESLAWALAAITLTLTLFRRKIGLD